MNFIRGFVLYSAFQCVLSVIQYNSKDIGLYPPVIQKENTNE